MILEKFVFSTLLVYYLRYLGWGVEVLLLRPR